MAVTARPAEDREHERRSTTGARLQRNDAFMWGILDAAPDGIIVVEPTGRLVLANGRAEELFGHADDDDATDRPPSESGPIDDLVDRVSATGIYLQQIAGRVDDDTSRRLRCAIEELTIAVAAARRAVAG